VTGDRPRRIGVAPVVRAVLTVALLAVVVMVAAPSRAVPSDPLDAATVYAVDQTAATDGSTPVARILLSAPPRLATRTLTADDITVTVDGAPRPVRVQRLTADDLEIAVVVDTTLGGDALRTMQAALVELALQLPPGATMRVVGAGGSSSDAAPVPGPAISAVRGLQPTATGEADLGVAIDRADQLLDDSPRRRTALVVLGRGLSDRIAPVPGAGLDRLVWVVTVDGPAGDLLGARAAGRVVTLDGVDGVLPTVDDVGRALGSLYLVTVPLPVGDAGQLTLDIATDAGASVPVTLALDDDTLRPDDVEEAGAGAAPRDAGPRTDRGAAPGGDDGGVARADGDAEAWWLLAAGVATLLAAALIVTAVGRARGGILTVDRSESLPPRGTQRRTERMGPYRPPRPIAKPAPDTRASLAAAHRGLRLLGLATRATANPVPADMFGFAEARASAALEGVDRDLVDVVAGALDPSDTTDDVAGRALAMLAVAWEHTANGDATPPPVVEVSAIATGAQPSRRHRGERAQVPVRALNPLLDIALAHRALAREPGQGPTARATTVVSVMRAARLATPALTLSPWLLAHAERYRTALRDDPDDPQARDTWLRFVCDGLAAQARASIDRLERLGRLRDEWRAQADHSTADALADVLIAQPVVDERLVARRLALTAADTRVGMAMRTAVDAGWLAPRAGHPGQWIAGGVLGIFDDPVDVPRHDPAGHA
jgi:hypothetical protein